jgi:DNA helicase-2/ATP-dependent DNA helicase PcrA
LRFFEQAHIKDVSAFLKWVVNPHDEVAFKRMVKLMPGVGPRSADSLWEGVVRALAVAGTSNVQSVPTAETQPLSTFNPQLSTDSDEPTQPLPETVANPWEGLPSIKKLLMPLKVPAKAQKAWEQCVFTLDELAPGGRLAPPSQMIHSVMEAIYDDYARAKFPNYDLRREDLNMLANFARQYESAQAFLDQLALLTTMDSNAANDDERDRVTLSSVHQAKGLEWRAVFVIWLADGKFPTGRSLENPEAIEEERRLFYVAVTRAKDELYLTYPCMSFNSGYGDPLQRPSRFLGEVPKKLVEEWEVGGSY